MRNLKRVLNKLKLNLTRDRMKIGEGRWTDGEKKMVNNERANKGTRSTKTWVNNAQST